MRLRRRCRKCSLSSSGSSRSSLSMNCSPWRRVSFVTSSTWARLPRAVWKMAVRRRVEVGSRSIAAHFIASSSSSRSPCAGEPSSVGVRENRSFANPTYVWCSGRLEAMVVEEDLTLPQMSKEEKSMLPRDDNDVRPSAAMSVNSTTVEPTCCR
jgi:hypothetical protein